MPREKFTKEEQKEHDPYEVFVGTQPLENAPFKWKKYSGYTDLKYALDDFDMLVKKLSNMSRDDMMDTYEAPRVDVEVINQKGKMIVWCAMYRKDYNKFEKKELNEG